MSFKSKILNDLTKEEMIEELKAHRVEDINKKNPKIQILELFEEGLKPKTEVFKHISKYGIVPEMIAVDLIRLDYDVLSFLTPEELSSEAKNQGFEIPKDSKDEVTSFMEGMMKIKTTERKKFTSIFQKLIIIANQEDIKYSFLVENDKKVVLRMIKYNDILDFSSGEIVTILRLNGIHVGREDRIEILRVKLLDLFGQDRYIQYNSWKLDNILKNKTLEYNNERKLNAINDRLRNRDLVPEIIVEI
jgi:hypothetical protein